MKHLRTPSSKARKSKKTKHLRTPSSKARKSKKTNRCRLRRQCKRTINSYNNEDVPYSDYDDIAANDDNDDDAVYPDTPTTISDTTNDNETNDYYNDDATISTVETSSICEVETLTFRAQLRDPKIGLMTYLQTTMELSDTRANTIISRFNNILVFLQINDCYEKSVISLIKHQHGRLEQYVQHMKKKKFQPSTIVDNLDDISQILHWFVLFSLREQTDFQDLSIVQYKIEVLKKALKRTDKRDSKPGKTIEALVKNRRLPEGDNNVDRLLKLQQSLVSAFEWARHEDREITSKRYNRMVGLIIAGSYCHAPQGRVQGFSDVRMNQVLSTHQLLIYNAN